MNGEIIAIGLLLAVVTFVIMRLPTVDVSITPMSSSRRVMNWLPWDHMHFCIWDATISKSVSLLLRK